MFNRFHAWLFHYRRAAARNCFHCHITILSGTFLVDTGTAAAPFLADYWAKCDPGHFTALYS